MNHPLFRSRAYWPSRRVSNRNQTLGCRLDQRKQNERGSGGGEADRKRGGVVKKGLKPAGQRLLVPEVRVGGLSAASQFSDVFSLCSALLTLFGNATSTRVEAVRSALLSGCVEIPGSRASERH